VPNYAIYLRLYGAIRTELRRHLRDYKSLYRFLLELKKYTVKRLGNKLCKQITSYRKHYVAIGK